MIRAAQHTGAGSKARGPDAIVCRVPITRVLRALLRLLMTYGEEEDGDGDGESDDGGSDGWG